jgi:cation diffusion facilitator family transporter
MNKYRLATGLTPIVLGTKESRIEGDNKRIYRRSATMEWILQKRNAAWISVASNTFLTGFKLIAGFFTGSVSILSEAAHSAMDLLAAMIATFSVYAADRPPDQTHPYGHEKIENISGVIEGLLIFMAAAWIIYEAVDKLIHGVTLKYLGLGIITMAVSAVLNLFVAHMLRKTAVKNRSVALEADAMHLYTDVFTSLGVFAGLLIIVLARILWDVAVSWIDPVIAIGVAFFIIHAAYRITRKSFLPLMDISGSAAEILQINSIMARFTSRGLDFHGLRTRRAGGALHVDLHMGCGPGLSLEQGHNLSHELKAEIERSVAGAKLLVHVEPSNSIEVLSENDAEVRRIREELIKDQRVSEIKEIRAVRYREDLRLDAVLILDPKCTLAESHVFTMDLTRHLEACFPQIKETVLSLRPGDGWQKAIHDDDMVRIKDLVGEHQSSLAAIHGLEVVSSGGVHRIRLAFGVPPELPVSEADNIARHLEKDIKDLFSEGADVDIHVEPCREDCMLCNAVCAFKTR